MGLHDRLKTSNGSSSATAELLTGQSQREVPSSAPAQDPYAELKTRIHHACIATLGAELYKREATGDIGERVTRAVTEQLVLDRTPLTREERRQIIREITDDILGYGPLENFLRDDSVTEVMVNAYDQIYVERLGKLERTQAAFADNSHLLRIIDKIVSQIGRRVDEASPMVDARLPDGSRVNAIIPPLALKGPTLTIRKFSRDPYTMNDLISFGSISPKAAQFLAACVKGKLNVLISGGTGTGKTTTLNAMSAFIPGDERIVTIEDAAELQLQQEHVITLESRPPNIEGQGEVRIRPGFAHHRGPTDVVRVDHIAGRLPREAAGRADGLERRRRAAALAAGLHRAEAELPREDGGQRRHPPVELLQQGRRHGRSGGRPGTPGLEVQGSISMSRLRLAVAGLAFILLAVPAAASAAVQLRGVDATAYPTIRASIYTPNGGGRPALWENGTPVAGFQAQNLGRVKAIATLIDRSQSMRGKPLADASAGARAFVAAKQAADELSVIAFGSKVSTLSPFSNVKRDADLPLGRMKTDSVKGTALYDAVIAAANQLKGNPLPGRVIIVLSDGADNASSGTLATAIKAAGEANASVYAIGIEGEGFTADPLEELAR